MGDREKKILLVDIKEYRITEKIKDTCISMGFEKSNIFATSEAEAGGFPDSFEYYYVTAGNTFEILKEIRIKKLSGLTGHGGLHVATQCGVFKGTTKAVFVDRREYTGPLWEQIEEAYQFVLRNIHLGATIVGIYRQDIYEIPPDAIRELIVNAMVHRSYLDHGMIQVAVYDNRLEITSPGKLPMGQTLGRMKEGYSKIRNEALAHAFSYMNLIEHWGSGIPRIIEKVKVAGLREPEFIGGEVDLRINIYRGQVATETSNGIDSVDKVPDSDAEMPDTTDEMPDSAAKVPDSADKVPDNEQEQQIYKYVLENGFITTATVIELLEVKQRRARAILLNMVESGWLKKEGAARSTIYVRNTEKR